ncbi:hypothetical protein [Paenibacillus eucommiae]|uniref:Uncharacterized protein n=1 Tax=Paenibacillus eucommiae TaxID=1355755 RepID=A0ABS4IZ68_9BACL|nr:hypothetical protein [Paenibacillus eucommiae]MBP1992871.1 hypothetical protein [Paenibacillus eucommiae]
MAEKNILAFFHAPDQAEAIAAKLRSLRVIDVKVDRFSRYPGTGVDSVMNPITGEISSLGVLTQGADVSSPSAGILMAADPAASGMSDGGNGGATGKNILLTVVVEENNYEQALRVIREGGGEA